MLEVDNFDKHLASCSKEATLCTPKCSACDVDHHKTTRELEASSSGREELLLTGLTVRGLCSRRPRAGCNMVSDSSACAVPCLLVGFVAFPGLCQDCLLSKAFMNHLGSADMELQYCST